MFPVYKKESQTCQSNYQPISLLSVCNKWLAKLMFNRLIIDFLEKKKVFFDSQFAFRANHSTDHAILSIVDKIQRAIDERDFSCGILNFLDFSKAFDTINHEILLKKIGVLWHMWDCKSVSQLISFKSSANSHCKWCNFYLCKYFMWCSSGVSPWTNPFLVIILLLQSF